MPRSDSQAARSEGQVEIAARAPEVLLELVDPAAAEFVLRRVDLLFRHEAYGGNGRAGGFHPQQPDRGVQMTRKMLCHDRFHKCRLR